MKATLGIFGIFILLVLVMLGGLIYNAGTEDTIVVTSTQKKRQPLRVLKQSEQVDKIEATHPPFSGSSTAPIVQATPIPRSMTDQEPLIKPVFYSIKPEKVESLSVEQQWGLKQTQEAYLSYYNEWMKRYPRDTNGWNMRMKELHDDLVMKLGSDSADQLLQ